MKIGLMGCEFSSPNKGCEALTYSLISILNDTKTINDGTIIYNFSGTKLGYIPKEFPRFIFKNIDPKLKDIKLKYLRALKECDVILDATMGDSFSDIYSKVYFKSLMKHKRIAEFLCKNYILLPQTYGPFYDSESKKLGEKVLKRAIKIYCRDQLSKDLLEKDFNINNSVLTSDMAFILPYNKNKYKMNNTKKIRVGINISGLLYRGGFESDNQFNLKLNYKKYIEKLIEYLLEKKDYEIHIIPHVIDLKENSHDDDYKICEKYAKKYKECILAPAFSTPIEAKSYISNMDIFIGARMHSTIASFSSGVITVPVSYSRKFEGLYNSLDYNFLIDCRKYNTDEALEKTIDYIDNRNDLKKSQEKAIKKIETKNNLFMKDLKALL